MSFPFSVSPIEGTDGYKLDHISQYDPRTDTVNDNWTPRKSRLPGVNYVMHIGSQFMVQKYFIEDFQSQFFDRPEDEVVDSYLRRINSYLPKPISVEHIRDLHRLGYIPLSIRAIKEGMSTPVGVAQMVIENTGGKKFMWVTNYFETLFSCEIWQPSTCGTIAREYRELAETRMLRTNSLAADFVDWQMHNFSMRGMPGMTAAITADFGHLASFVGSDTFPTPSWIKHYYKTDYEKELVSGGVAATEHSVMCVGTGIFLATQDGQWEHYGDFEFQVFKRLITEVYPNGIVSIVSDTWDLWKVITEYTVLLKDDIMARDGKVVFRPDSGIPADIICGCNYGIISLEITDEDTNLPMNENDAFGYSFRDFDNWHDNEYWGKNDKFPSLVLFRGKYYKVEDRRDLLCKDNIVSLNKAERKGVIECLWDVFGGTVSPEGFKVLDSHVGAIYGDAITLERATDIFDRLEAKGFASTNIVLGIGSYTYQMITRDTFGFAMKATHAVAIDAGKKYNIDIFKDPITDNGTKKSARGYVLVNRGMDGVVRQWDQVSYEKHQQGILEPIFLNGKVLRTQSLIDIRNEAKEFLKWKINNRL